VRVYQFRHFGSFAEPGTFAPLARQRYEKIPIAYLFTPSSSIGLHEAARYQGEILYLCPLWL
jgi:hypothetical protein